ncbi:hypothetical protein HD806DRAFT_527538 [Xylariaceae sp. AK1471]|nr:hypothetical protein HD806DRAFT_527538 [Xylariaceae sp. AK1471]
MFSCGCGRTFNSEGALAQHQSAKQKTRAGSACQNRPAPSASKAAPKLLFAHDPRDRWMWKGARTSNAFHVIAETNLEPSVNMVSSETGYQLICSYDWLDSKQASIQIPGFIPIWQHVPLPITLPADKGNYFINQNAARIPQYSFESLFRAAEVTSPGIDFGDVDIVINRNSLRKFLDFCAGSVRQSFRVNLSVIHNTLFIERCERNARDLIRGAGGSGWGHNFEKTFTKLPEGVARSTQHHRVLKYALGELNCVIRFEVDACYKDLCEEDNQEQEKSASSDVQNELVLDIGNLSIGSNSRSSETVSGQISSVEKRLKLMPQSTAAEIKTISSHKTLGSFLPQLWGHHIEGTFDKVTITNAGLEFTAWENKHQTELRRMVSLLSQLREAVKKSGSKRCMAICEKRTKPRNLMLFESTQQKGTLPDDLIGKFWGGGNNEVVNEGSK